MKQNYKRTKSLLLLALGLLPLSGNAQFTEENPNFSDQKLIDVNTGEKVEASVFNNILQESLVQNKAINVTWQSAGPNNIGGRIRALHTSTETEYWAGGISGGLFHTLDGGNTWAKITSYVGSPYISSITEDVNGVLYITTGSKYENWIGGGMYYSEDDGNTWNLVAGTEVFPVINKAVSSSSLDGVLFSTDYGLKKWSPSSNQIEDVGVGSNGPVNTLCISDDGNVLLATIVSDTYVSTDSGVNWLNVSGNSSTDLPNTGFGRIEFGVSNEKPDGSYTIYASLSDDNLVAQWLSKDTGSTWEQYTGTPANYAALNIFNYRGNENSSIAVNPNDDKEIMVGGFYLFNWLEQTPTPANGGWEQVSDAYLDPTSPLYLHSGINEIKWAENGDITFATDGGIFLSDDNAQSFYPANRNLNTTQFYSIAYDRNGNIIGGSNSNGTLYNSDWEDDNYDFKSYNFGANYEAEISFFNPELLITSASYNRFYRSVNGGTHFQTFAPVLPAGYDDFGTNVQYPEHTEFTFAEYYDEDSKDSVIFYAYENYSAGDVIPVNSKSTGDTIWYTTPVDLEFSDTVHFDPNLTTTDYEVTDVNSSSSYDLGVLPFSYLNSTSTNYPPTTGDSLLVNSNGGLDTIVVDQITPYTHYFGSSNAGEVYDLGQDEFGVNIVWDTVKIQDPYQSWFVFTTLRNGGEVWGSRDALRISESNPKWVKLAENMGTGEYDMEFSEDLNYLFIASGGALTRLSGLKDVYSSEVDFESKSHMDSSSFQINAIDFSGADYIAGVGLNPSNPDVVIGVRGQFNGAVVRCENATSTTPVFTELSTLSMALYDVVIDRYNDQLLVAGGAAGAMISEDGGTTWTNCSGEFAGTPVYELKQNWRSNNYFGNKKSGELYIATFGRGVYVSSSILGIDEGGNFQFTSNSTKDVICYPNPVHNHTSFDLVLNNASNLILEVYSQTGQLISTQEVKANKGRQNITLHTSHLDAGLYILNVVGNGQKWTSKFVK